MTRLLNFGLECNGWELWSRLQSWQPTFRVKSFFTPEALFLRNRLIVVAFFLLIMPIVRAQQGGEAAQPAALPQAQRPDSVRGQAKVELHRLLVKHDRGRLAIELVLSGPVKPALSTLDSPSRIVLDLPNTVAVTLHRRIAVGGDGVKAVRVGMDGQIPPTTRVVVDLTLPVEHEIVQGTNNNLILRMRALPANTPGFIVAPDHGQEPSRQATEVPALPSVPAQLQGEQPAATTPRTGPATIPGEAEDHSGADRTQVERASGSSPNAGASIPDAGEPSEESHKPTATTAETPTQPSPGVQSQDEQPTSVTPRPGVANVMGVVEDQTGAVIPSADVTLTEETHGTSRNTVSDNSGRFVFKNVPPGHYLLHGKAEDMQTAGKKVVVAGNPVDVNLQMKVRVEEKVTVTDVVPDPVSPDNNSDAVDLNATLLRDLPTDSQNLLPLLTNFVAPAAGGTEGISLVVDGMEADQIDDLPASAIKEVAINRNPYDVEFRRPGKARIEITTKHGSRKRYHGHFGIFARDSVLDAKNRFAVAQPDLSRKLFEGTFGGPLGQKGTTFFLSGQHLGDTESAIVNATILNSSNQPVSLIQNVPTGLHRSDYLARLDIHPGQVHTLTAFYSFDEKFESNNGVGGFNLEDRGISTALRGHKFQFSDQAILSPTLLNTARLLIRRSSSRAGNLPSGYAIDVNGNFASGPSQTSQHQVETVGEFEDSASYTHQNQTFRFGGGTRIRSFDLTDQSNFGGTFKFSGLAQFSQGTPYVFSINQGQPNVTYEIHQANGFIQDEIRFQSTVSLVAGLRYDWQSTITNHYSLAPRLALAYSPGDRRTVFRVGGGLFYEYLPQSVTAKALLLDNEHVEQVVIANPSYPNPFAGGTTVPPSVVRIAPNLTTPYLVQASASVERNLGGKNHLAVEYQMLRGLHLFRSRDVNAPLPLTGLRPDSAFFNIDQVESAASMRSDALTLSYRGGLGKHFNVIAHYSFSKTTNDTSGPFSLPANNYDLRPEMGRADFDQRHRFNLMGVVNLPGAFRVGTVLSVASGIPFDITTGADNDHDSVANDRPPGVTRNTGDGPGLLQVDLRVTKLFHVWRPSNRDQDSPNLELSIDAFNVINHANYPNFVGVMSSPLFGRPNTALPARTLQTSLGYRF